MMCSASSKSPPRWKNRIRFVFLPFHLGASNHCVACALFFSTFFFLFRYRFLANYREICCQVRHYSSPRDRITDNYQNFFLFLTLAIPIPISFCPIRAPPTHDLFDKNRLCIGGYYATQKQGDYRE